MEKENKKEFITELNKINNFNLEFETPKILDIFSDNEKYYEDLLKQLRFFLTQYKMDNQHKECKVSNSSTSRIFWLNFNKILLLNLSENNIKEDYIKIIFYFIVNLFNPDISSNSLEFREDVIPKLFNQCPISTELIDNQEIYEIIDNYKYYPDFKVKKGFYSILY